MVLLSVNRLVHWDASYGVAVHCCRTALPATCNVPGLVRWSNYNGQTTTVCSDAVSNGSRTFRHCYGARQRQLRQLMCCLRAVGRGLCPCAIGSTCGPARCPPAGTGARRVDEADGWGQRTCRPQLSDSRDNPEVESGSVATLAKGVVQRLTWIVPNVVLPQDRDSVAVASDSRKALLV